MKDKVCWCGGAVGVRTPGDDEGLGCLEDINHFWQQDPRHEDDRVDAAALGLNALASVDPLPNGEDIAAEFRAEG